MKIGIIGSRGIPNYYGGFEQFAEFFAVYLASVGESVFVYAPHDHPYKESMFQGVRIIRCYDPEKKLGTAGQFVYDLNCILDARKRDFDVILQLGYTSSTVWHRLLPRKPLVFTNMDGLEWKRSKYSKAVQRFLRYAERLGVKGSNYLIADSKGIQKHLKETYSSPSRYIPYGAHIFDSPDLDKISSIQVEPNQYDMLIARMEPENNIEMILDGVVAQGGTYPFLVVGNQRSNAFGRYLENKYKDYPLIRFLGGIYDLELLNNLRYYSRLYFHGHSVGGTNPSLLEAMASRAVIAAHSNVFNHTILGEDALYFDSSEKAASILSQPPDENRRTAMADNNIKKIELLYSWDRVNKAYLDFFKEALTSAEDLTATQIEKSYSE